MMRLLCVLVVVFISGVNAAFDSVIWSSDPLNDKTIDGILTSASVSYPVVVYALENFTLATFTQKANAFSSTPTNSPFIGRIKNSKYVKAASMGHAIQIQPDTLAHTAAEAVGKSLTVYELSSWEELEKLAPQVEQTLKTPLTSVISSSAAFSTVPVEKRQKRVSVSSDVNFDEEEEPINEPKRPKGKSKSAKLFAYGGRIGGSRKTTHGSRYWVANAQELPMPVVLPPVNINESSFVPTPNDYCLLYLEAVNVVVARTEVGGSTVYRNLVVDAANGTNTFSWDPSYVSCSLTNKTIGIAKFQIYINVKTDMTAYYEKGAVFTIKAGQIIAFELTFNGSYTHYWNLVHLTMLGPLTISNVANGAFLDGDVILPANANTSATRYMGIESFYQYAYGCSGTQAAFMVINENYMVGIALNNIEVDLKAHYDQKGKFIAFNRDVYDCVGTFSVGSWMGIICSVVLASVLIFGYLMLQSVQTMDRFDDPKQKQIVINFKE